MREESFSELWLWLVDLRERGRPELPLRISAGVPHKRGRRNTRADLTVERITFNAPDNHRQAPVRNKLGSPDFSWPFEKYLDHTMHPAVYTALNLIKPLPGDLPPLRATRQAQWRVVAQVLTNGTTESEACRAKHQMSARTFQVAATG